MRANRGGELIDVELSPASQSRWRADGGRADKVCYNIIKLIKGIEKKTVLIRKIMMNSFQNIKR